MSDPRPHRVTIVANEQEAALVSGLLESAGISSMVRITDAGFGAGGEVPSSGSGAREVLVREEDLAAARAVLADVAAEDESGAS